MDVERQIRNALEARFEKLAPTELKNISVAMDLFRIVLPWEQPSISRREEAPTSKSEIRSPKSEIGMRPVTSAATKWIAIVLALLLVISVGWWWTTQPHRTPASPPTVSRITSLAVLPFKNYS